MTTPRDDLQLRPATPDDFEGVRSVLGRAFGEEWTEDELGYSRALFEPARNVVFADGDRVVANAGAYTRDMTVPGAVVPAAHVTMVGVHPTHRRRGLLTRLMHHQLREVREAGAEPFAVLWASEGRIYQRFGYGQAALKLEFEPDLRDLKLLPRISPGGGRLRETEPAEARKELIDVFERARPARSGWSSRNEHWWDRILHDPKEERGGAGPRKALLYEDAGGVNGYALWRTKMEWGGSGPAGHTEIRELVAVSPEAYTELWRFLLSVDLTRYARFWAASTDEPVVHMLDEPRALCGRLSDSLWVRIVDLPAALTARRYATTLDTTLDVTDALLPDNSGRWRLRADGETVTCVPVPSADGDADLALDVADLGAAYLGGVSLVSLAGTGRVRELRPGALAAASVAFGWTRAPSAIEIF